jgi:hypothetical protein
MHRPSSRTIGQVMLHTVPHPQPDGDGWLTWTFECPDGIAMQGVVGICESDIHDHEHTPITDSEIAASLLNLMRESQTVWPDCGCWEALVYVFGDKLHICEGHVAHYYGTNTVRSTD